MQNLSRANRSGFDAVARRRGMQAGGIDESGLLRDSAAPRDSIGACPLIKSEDPPDASH